jgi:hypothetical protein
METNNTTRTLSVTDGRDCIGHLIDRGKTGVEAFDAGEVSIGLFKNVQLAARACWLCARGQPIGAR